MEALNIDVPSPDKGGLRDNPVTADAADKQEDPSKTAAPATVDMSNILPQTATLD